MWSGKLLVSTKTLFELYKSDDLMTLPSVNVKWSIVE
jgi:hypothetical protein